VELSGGAAWLMQLLSASIGAILIGNKKFLFQRDAPICGAFAASFIFRRRFQCETTADCSEIWSSLRCSLEIEVEVMNIRNNVRDPEDRVIDERSEKQRKEKMMDKTVADSFPASDPPSSLPNPGNDSFNS
jgi:hypothetical protein